jgi:Cdc6-like AAA superfamily ATPase
LPGSPSEQVLSEWLRKRPANELFRDGLELISELLCSRPAEVRRKITREIVELCARVAAASGGLFGLGQKTSDEERRVINKLREHIEVPKESA